MGQQDSAMNVRKLAATPRGVGVMCQWFVERAENATLWDTQGNEYIDFAGGIAVLNTGHRHPKIIAAVTEQLGKFTHTAYQVVPYESYVSLVERIIERAPVTSPAKAALFTTGAEAVENAVKIARAATKRHGVITFGGAFHGRTFMTMAMTGKTAPYKRDFGVMPSGVFHARYPVAVNGISVDDAIESLEDIFSTDIAAHDVAAIVLEPVQGEGGFNVAPQELMIRLRQICDQHGILLIADEVQTGFARTGKLFAMEHYPDVKADLITMAKSLGGGFPISGVVGRADLMDAPNPGGLGGTYAGNPLAVVAAHAVIDVIEEEKLCDRANKLGAQLINVLEDLRDTHSFIRDIRGLGSMIAIELNTAEQVKVVQEYAMSKKLVLLSCGKKANVIRFLYPLTIPDAQFQNALEIIKEGFAAIATKKEDMPA
ncbi:MULTISPECIES: 4-aminobutyrate--2-oxoglutarate transaminase [unclassified Acinetobacter]|uniref:4-aminobutyrate--2-oxoglutarate transaminase n=1 Tax=unclassified Acinetobacter TaxID=196816 RepID=UPI002574A55E|nr:MULTISPECIES: 4-aminobutyrate--2-oxoglutarate transaminase [unclassified Acinetobacter]MDM1764289.1 4-aminobutyrate--2-oxoglutarate transaminase [Acinetobacter sp. 226-1]MDM1767814.1 4-aminobutyrate--2-oxoglutarate transaminase [Acinetobacter sp. 226-4]